MGYPRHRLVDPERPGTYHCVSRCVRRAYLCGFDAHTGRSFEHRKGWLEARLLALAEVFALDVLAYAVMSNHLHVVAYVEPLAPLGWSDEEVARRWLRVFRPRRLDEEGVERAVERLAGDGERLVELRERLGSLSWFMRCLKEPIARWANREDDCSGRFWEGRFSCQAVLDEKGVLACMAYVDLNPVRAGRVGRPEAAAHTSARRRARRHRPEARLAPVAGSLGVAPVAMREAHYLELLDWSGRRLAPGKRGFIPARSPPILARLGLEPEQWCMRVGATESAYWRAIGSAQALREKAERMGQRWLCGIRFAEATAAPT